MNLSVHQTALTAFRSQSASGERPALGWWAEVPGRTEEAILLQMCWILTRPTFAHFTGLSLLPPASPEHEWTLVSSSSCPLPSQVDGQPHAPMLYPTLHLLPCEYNFRDLLCRISLSCWGLDCAPLPRKTSADSLWGNPLGYSHLCTHFLRTDGIL